MGWLSHLDGWMFHQKSLQRHDAWAGMLSWWSCQSAVANSYGTLNHPNSFCRGMFKLNAKFDADLLLHLLSHFECDSHTVHMLTQRHLPPPLSIVKSSLFTHAHSSPLSLAATLHRCGINCSDYIYNGWIFPDRPHIAKILVLKKTHLHHKIGMIKISGWQNTKTYIEKLPWQRKETPIIPWSHQLF